MSVLDGFYATWNDARQTFGHGTPQPGARFDNSAQLQTLGTGLDNAKPADKWSGTAASNYDKAHTEHQKVFRKLAELDQKLAQQVDRSAQLVGTGRENLDSLRQWVTDAANSIPPGKQRDMMLMQVAKKGLGRLTEVVKTSNEELNGVSQDIRNLTGEYDDAGIQKFSNDKREGGGDAQALSAEDEKKADDVRKRAEQDVQDALAGDRDAAGRVQEVIGAIKPGQPLRPEQQSYLSQMQAQQSGMSIDALRTAEQRLGEHKPVIANSWQLMSNDNVQFSQTETTPEALDDPATTSNGGFDKLPESVQAALNRDGIDNLWDKATDPIGPRTDNARDVSAIADIVRDGDTALQMGTKLDDAMLDWSREALHDQQGPSIFESVGVADDYAQYAAARDDALAGVFNTAGHDHQAVSAELVSDTGQQFLTDLHTHAWADTPNTTENQQSTHSLLSWIGDEANSSNPEIAGRSGAAAHALAVNLDANHELYLRPPESPYGPSPTAANLNPALISADAIALAPYQDALVGDMRGIHGFEMIGDPGNGDLRQARNIFAVIDSDPGAAKYFNAAAESKIVHHQDAFAGAVRDGGGSIAADTEDNDLTSAAQLLGIVNGSAEQEAITRGLQGAQVDQAVYDLKKAGIDSLFEMMPGHDFIPGWNLTRETVAAGILGPTPTEGQAPPNVVANSARHAINVTSYQVADALGAQAGDAHIDERFFDEGGKLLPPDAVSAADRSDYRGDLENYLENKQYRTFDNDFIDAYQEGAGIAQRETRK